MCVMETLLCPSKVFIMRPSFRVAAEASVTDTDSRDTSLSISNPTPAFPLNCDSISVVYILFKLIPKSTVVPECTVVELAPPGGSRITKNIKFWSVETGNKFGTFLESTPRTGMYQLPWVLEVPHLRLFARRKYGSTLRKEWKEEPTRLKLWKFEYLSYMPQ